MASEVSILTVQLPAEPTSKALDTRQYTKLRFPSPIPPQQLRQDNHHRNDYLKPSANPRGDYHQGMPRVRSREKLLPTPPGTPTQRYYRPRMQHIQPNRPSPRPISYVSSDSQRSDFHQQHENSSASSSPLSRTPVSASEMDDTTISTVDSPVKATSQPKSDCASDHSAHSVGPPKKVEYHTPPLNKSHFSCYHFHRTFVRSSNVLYPLNCMTCLKSDQEVRWRCVFCCLRICGDCVKGIKSCKDRSLMEFMEKLVMDLEAASAAESEKSQSEKAESMNTVESTESGDIDHPET
ncbi:uncharacterized protein GIQ15_04846 [Arthroderma uncinatum]|uniref:uncharacterized protein n=1 Tax=Arthroderma uncinatum TaxID=74035 RepID=UPI00144A9982|nr:uncharacterized protein GIQ15_04846 [Arthroderma uncinatum]KAF3482087.1 hypothetical protein GIQ15_04846 [Arthroderma uncinatum]